jgi:hypothetical protein
MTHMFKLETDEVDRLIDLLSTYRENVENGDISGYDQPVADELSDVDTLIFKLQESKDKLER